jgi:BASS family bile acid:Na+ symporter
MTAQDAIGIVSIVYASANLFSMGLELEFAETMRQVRSVKLVLIALFWSWIVCPAVALLLNQILPLSSGYATGLIIFSLAPTAPALPLFIRKSGADMSFAAALMPLAVLGTVVMMPVLAPVLIPGLEVSPVAIAKPLLLTVLLPLVVAVVFKLRAPVAAAKLFPFAKKLAGIVTLLLLVSCLGLYWKPLLGAIGHWGPLAQILFTLITAALPYLIAPGYRPAQRKAMSLGICTRNGGAMMVAITAFPTLDPELLLMILISIPVPIIVWALIARFFATKIPNEAR